MPLTFIIQEVIIISALCQLSFPVSKDPRKSLATYQPPSDIIHHSYLPYCFSAGSGWPGSHTLSSIHRSTARIRWIQSNFCHSNSHHDTTSHLFIKRPVCFICKPSCHTISPIQLCYTLLGRPSKLTAMSWDSPLEPRGNCTKWSQDRIHKGLFRFH